MTGMTTHEASDKTVSKPTCYQAAEDFSYKRRSSTTSRSIAAYRRWSFRKQFSPMLLLLPQLQLSYSRSSVWSFHRGLPCVVGVRPIFAMLPMAKGRIAPKRVHFFLHSLYDRRSHGSSHHHEGQRDSHHQRFYQNVVFCVVKFIM